jgi:hypothetical protein
MNKYPLIGGSICAVVLLILASLTNVVGYQTVQSSNQKVISIEVDQKELLFQTIVDMANNKEIQRVILGSELTSKRFFDSGMKFLTFKIPVVTKQFLERIYTIGVILFRTLDKSRIQALSEHRPITNQGLQKKLSAVIAKDATLKSEMTKLSDLKCDCYNESTLNWKFPILCIILALIYAFGVMLYFIGMSIEYSRLIIGFIVFFIGFILMVIAGFFGEELNCSWIPPYQPFIKD